MGVSGATSSPRWPLALKPRCSYGTRPSRSRCIRRSSFVTAAAANALHTDTFVQMAVAVTVFAAVLPQVIALAKPALLPIRCRTCMGATTNLCNMCGSRGKKGGLFTSEPLICCQQCKGLGRITCSACKGKGMVNSWLWQTDMSGPKKAAQKSPKASPNPDENQPLFGNTSGSGDGSPPENFPYPRLGDNSIRKSFRDLVKEQQKEWRV